ncbi:MAG: SprT-like domain-containing protein [Syntrophotaleaceae bacterium]
MPCQRRSSTLVGAQVRFEYQGRELTGTVARLESVHALILGTDRQSYRILKDCLLPLHAPAVPAIGEKESSPPKSLPRQVLSPGNLHVGERVRFSCRRQLLEGCIVRLNAKRAHVICDNDDEYAVPYGLLALIEGELTASTVRSPEGLQRVGRLAEKLLAEHGLAAWRFDFDHAVRRAGSCQYRQKRITLSLQFARQASDEEILDTLLHEIAHALVGHRHNHDAVWQAKALEIGGSGERCHDRRFCPPRYIVQCRNGCWTLTAERRRRNVVCRKCRGEINYQTYTAERWRELKASSGVKQGA